MSEALIARANPEELARREVELEGEIPLSRLDRLAGVVVSREGLVKVRLSFSYDESKRIVIDGSVDCGVRLLCQRCLDVFLAPIHAEFRLAVVRDEEQARRLPEQYDPLLLPDGAIIISELVTDELILAIPGFPMHADPSECSGDIGTVQTQSSPTSARANPFAVLEKLKSR